MITDSEELPILDGWPVVPDTLLQALEVGLNRRQPLTTVAGGVTVREVLWVVKELQHRRAQDNQG